MRRTALAILGLFALAGCSLAPKYVRPEPPVPSTWQAAGTTGDGTAASKAAPHVAWQELVTDPQLQTVIATALANNRDLRVATLNIERARALYRIERSALYPGVGAEAGGEKARVPADLSYTGRAQTSEQYSVSLGIAEWELDLFGRVRSLKDQALAQYLATEQARSATELSLVAAVSDAYLSLVADREALSIAQDTLAAREKSSALVRRSRELGVASELDLRQAESQVDGARVELAGYKGIVARDENALELLVGAPVASDLVPESLDAVAALAAIDPGLGSEVLLRRPDVRAAEYQLMASNANIGAARAAFFPRIALTAATGTASSDLTGLFKSGSGAWSFAPRISAPIFAGGSLRANLAAAQVDRDIAVAQYEKAIQAAFREANDALALRATLADQQEAQQSLVASLAATIHLAQARYRGGLTGYLEVLVAQQSLYSAQQGLVGLELAARINQVTLFKVLGGGTAATAPEAGHAVAAGGPAPEAREAAASS